ncbi:TPA: DUF3967 domain-containing protein [Bacillus wiedmannii]|nr:DUF3967 domain-containing protein [Bacillus wiedmannii]MDF9663918.1 DUF3967 domain-containing protein [Bacillus wiedmannii]HDR7659504.1 DUF3967 domain-containing protein [Bacillus wiedmannii]HDR7869676.1 DUF3967 domain-containing protein [Bacillus wiedmannii]HDR7961631.1 DUF3967 domain-containing protein [Bacillus wiedmannii]
MQILTEIQDSMRLIANSEQKQSF